ncbi:MAG: hypothetical protein KF910_04215 [Brevundimonas sp.]|uniref:hypothetical protein n=1 Tax=Brevundimonas sp. TaxID=1871086 RepID=UPI0025BBDF48|nr:hypothetical protein [Brevundimonas sp.]MBX3476786.1 hypothetical protein [Brevundimonas sp.]
MRVLTSAAIVALILSSPAIAGERGGRRPPPSPHGPCGGCRPPATPNINVNVNASASASASASARSYINARAYASGASRTYVGGGTIISGGGYVGDYGLMGGGPVHVDDRNLVPAAPSAPFGYAVQGFGRDYRAGPPVPRGDRYGREGRWRDQAGSYDQDHYERWESDAEYRRQVEAAWAFEIIGRESRAYDRGYDDGRADCDCRAPHPAPHFHAPAPEPDHRPQPASGLPYYGDLPPPDAAPMGPPPRHDYRQEPGERG